MKLSLSQFIKLTEAALTPIKAHVTRVFLNGEEYVALEQKGLNEWTWLKISGRNPERNQHGPRQGNAGPGGPGAYPSG